MKHAILGLALLVLGTTASAQTTYNASNVPFMCNAASEANGPTSISAFFCRGIRFANSTAELFFGSQFELYTSDWTVSSNSTQSWIAFTQPNPVACPVTGRYHSGCPEGTVPGTLEINWSGTDTSGTSHNGTISATWTNVQVCGGARCWYHPVLGEVTLTINQ